MAKFIALFKDEGKISLPSPWPPLWHLHHIIQSWLSRDGNVPNAGMLFSPRKCGPTLPGTSRRSPEQEPPTASCPFPGTFNVDAPWLSLGWSLREPKGRLGRPTAPPGSPSLPELASWGRPRTPRGSQILSKMQRGHSSNSIPSCCLRLRTLSPAEHVKPWMCPRGPGAELGSDGESGIARRIWGGGFELFQDTGQWSFCSHLSKKATHALPWWRSG